MIFFELFWSFFQVGLFSIGGGMAALPLIQNQVVDLHHWLTLTEFTDLITISEMTPGPIAINSATFVGTQIAGLGGAVVATIGCIVPSCLIVSLVSWIYYRFQNLRIVQGVLSGLRPAVVALIASAGVTIFGLAVWGEHGFAAKMTLTSAASFFLFACALFVLRKWKPNPIFVMLGAGIVGGIIHSIL